MGFDAGPPGDVSRSGPRRYSTAEQREFECPNCGGIVSQTDSYAFECWGSMSGHPQEWGCGWFGFAKRKGC